MKTNELQNMIKAQQEQQLYDLLSKPKTSKRYQEEIDRMVKILGDKSQMILVRHLASLLSNATVTRKEQKVVDKLVSLLGDLGQSFLKLATVDRHIVQYCSSIESDEDWETLNKSNLLKTW